MCRACAAYKKQIEFMSKTMRKVMQERSVVDDKKVSQLEKEVIEKVLKGA